jgi:hypothetical protein
MKVLVKKRYMFARAFLLYFCCTSEPQSVKVSNTPSNMAHHGSTLSPPKIGPAPTLISRKEVDALYEILAAVSTALTSIGVDYIVTGGSLLGAIRQHSVLFCDDDIDIAVIDRDGSGAYEAAREAFSSGLLGPLFAYTIRPWEGGDRVRLKRMPNVFLDLFTLRRYANRGELTAMLGVKKNGEPQSEEYVKGVVEKMENSAFSAGEATPLFPAWHFNTRKSVEMWAKEVYREKELFPLERTLEFGPLTGISGPRMPVLLLKRAFGKDCFECYYQSGSHSNVKPPKGGAAAAPKKQPHLPKPADAVTAAATAAAAPVTAAGAPAPVAAAPAAAVAAAAALVAAPTLSLPAPLLPPLLQTGGQWECGRKALLEDEHFLPMQPVSRKQRRYVVVHCAETTTDRLLFL